MHNSQRLLMLIALGLATLAAGCGSDGGEDNALAVLTGLVTDGNGAPLPGATVRSGSATTATAGDGSYTLSVAAGADRKVEASRAGCVTTFEILNLSAGQTVPLDFTLTTVGQTTALTSLLTTPATITDPRGAEVTLAANTLVDSTGAPVDAATLELTTSLPSDVGFAASFPGLFIGVTNGAETAIESFGFVTINLTSSGGLPCNLAPGATADIAIPADPNADPGTPTIPFWSLDETTGIWQFVADATRDTGGSTIVYRAQVSHFSTYNLDRPIFQSIPFAVTVETPTGGRAVGASVVVTSTNQAGGAMWEGRAVTDSNGTAFFPAVPPGSLTAKAAATGQFGLGSGYDLIDGVGVMTIRLLVSVQRTITAVYLNNGVETPIPNLALNVFQTNDFGDQNISATTDANGQATLDLMEGYTSYVYDATTVIGGVTLTTYGVVGSTGAIPAKWVLTPPSSR